jgi:1,4-alpha-glucan branching enzyme
MVHVTGGIATFEFFRPQAKSVHIAGDFNGWKENDLPMVRTSAGYWYARLRLAEGSYRFRYCADGQWFADYAAFGIENGPYGPDSVLRVAASPPARRRKAWPRRCQNLPPAGMKSGNRI